jgi:hypothetical protein
MSVGDRPMQGRIRLWDTHVADIDARGIVTSDTDALLSLCETDSTDVVQPVHQAHGILAATSGESTASVAWIEVSVQLRC